MLTAARSSRLPLIRRRRRSVVGSLLDRALCFIAALMVAALMIPAASAAGLDYLDGPCDPYYVHQGFLKLVTPQWVGDPRAEAVVVVAIDDMRDVAKYEAFLRPILDRLKSIDGSAPLSIMTNSVDPQHPHLQTWLKEGVSIEVHTTDHPCPCLQQGDFPAAERTYHGCVDEMASIPGNRPVAFRMPCCDSLNTPSPRFWAEIFGKTSPAGNFLQIDSSVFQLFTAADPELPRHLVIDSDGQPRFQKYLPFPSFVNIIENYPYPYVINRTCWEFPCMVPSDWEAQNLQRPNNPRTVEDMKAALDATVVKQGVFNLVFHPHGWIRNDQIVELIDYADKTYGPRVKFLSFGQAQERLNQHLLDGHPLRGKKGEDNGVRLLDVNRDGYMDVVIANARHQRMRIWNPDTSSWADQSFPCALVQQELAPDPQPAGSDEPQRRAASTAGTGGTAGAEPGLGEGTVAAAEVAAGGPRMIGRIGQVLLDGKLRTVVIQTEPDRRAWVFADESWREEARLVPELPSESDAESSESALVVLRDVDLDAQSELIWQAGEHSAVYRWNAIDARWDRQAFSLPPGVRLARPEQPRGDTGCRLVDLDEDGRRDIIFSDEKRFGIYLWKGWQTGWSARLVDAMRSERSAPAETIPPIARFGTNNGAWFLRQHLWIQNEDTDRLPDKVDRRSYRDLLTIEWPKVPTPAGSEPTSPTASELEQSEAIAPASEASADDREASKDDGGAAGSPFLVGAARIEITPEPPIRLHGYIARTSESQSIGQPIYARAMAIGSHRNADGQPSSGPAVLIAVDCLGIPREVTRAVAERLAQAAGLAADRLVIAATHTHSAPVIRGVAPTLFGHALDPAEQGRIDDYTDRLVEKLVEVAIAALDARQPAHLAWSVGTVDFAANRRTEGGPVDHRLPILTARRPDGQLIALLATYACHATTLPPEINQVHGDWPGVAAKQLEEQLPGVVALVTIGCGADANPKPRGSIELAEAHGRALATEVLARLSDSESWKGVDGEILCRQAWVQLPFDTLPSEAEWQARISQGGPVGYHAEVQLERLKRDGSLPQHLDYPVATWSFGEDLAMVFLAGEVVVDYSISMDDEFDGKRLWVHAYANDAPCYIPSRRVWREGGYEGGGAMTYYGLPTRLAPEVEDLILETVQRLLPHGYYSAEKQRDFPPPRSPSESRQSIHVRPDLRVELVAAEPLVIDPVAFDWGPDGRLWVIEMSDYPNGLDGRGEPGGRVVVLGDSDEDGQYDTRTVFYEPLPFPTGVKVWRDGLLVTVAPWILELRDRDGDGRADQIEVLYEGFGEGNQQHRVNGLRWGLDNWLYIGNGDSGGRIRSLRSGQVVNVSGRDLRIRPDSGQMDAQSGQTQYGRCRDDVGNWFGGNNSDPLWHYVLDDYYLRRNPLLSAPSVRRQVPEHPGSAPVFPASRTLERFNDLHTANRFTSACGPAIYRDVLLGKEYYLNSFVCEPVHNLVHREVMRPEGFSFRSRRASDEQQSEVLAAEDHWFRPVMARTGPDGALWIADMYRYVIEHPTWIPEDFQRRMDVRAGSDRGRIWRLVPRDTPPRRPPRLNTLTTEQLVAALDSPNGWQRDMVQQMLIWRADRAAVPLLKEMVRSHERGLARMHALCTLDGLDALDAELLAEALEDSDAGVRRHAVRLSQTWLDQAEQLVERLVRLAADDDPQVVMQLAYSLGASNSEQAAEGLADVLLRFGADPVARAAAFSSLRARSAPKVLECVLAAIDGTNNAANGALPAGAVEELAFQVTALAPEQTAERLGDWLGAVEHLRRDNDAGAAPAERSAQSRAYRWALGIGVLRGVERLDGSRHAQVLERIRRQTAPLLADARRLLDEPAPDASGELRYAIQLLRQDGSIEPDDYGRFGRILRPEFDLEVQLDAAEGLARLDDSARVSQELFAHWGTATPQLRDRILTLCMQRARLATALLDRLETGEVSVVSLGAARKTRLLEHPDQAIRQRAAALLAIRPDADRLRVLSEYSDVLQLEGSVQQGRQVFAKHCATCHQLEGAGTPLGPDLASLTNLSPHALLTAILDPNQAVEEKFLSFIVVLHDGRQLTGMLTRETTGQLTISAGGTEEHTLLRTDIEQIHASGKSLMPEGLENEMTRQDLADVIAYVRAHRPSPKTFPRNSPELVQPDSDGTLRLTAARAAIYGPRLIFEQQHQNLGWWEHPDDYAVWDVRIAEPGVYEVVLDYACDASAEGNRFELSIAGQTVTEPVPVTGSWDRYATKVVGKLELPAGHAELLFRSAGPINEQLVHLRQIVLRRAR